EAAWNYHNGTKHSYESIRANRHYLDWENQPLPLKIYPDLPAIPLPEHLSPSAMPALQAVSAPGLEQDDPGDFGARRLAEVLFLSAGITRRRSFAGTEILFRAAACTGALYHIDLYLVCGDLAGLDAGVYQFSLQDCQRLDVLAQRVEVPVACLPALLLGQRNSARQSSRRRRCSPNPGRSDSRLRRCRRERAAG